MRGGCVIVGLCVAALSTGCAGSSSPTAPTGAVPAAISLGGSISAAGVMGDPARSSRAAALVPFKGSLEGEYGEPSGEFPIFHESIRGEGNATHLGRYTLAIDETVNLLDATAVGTFVLTAANGDMVSGRFTGKAQPGPLVSITEEATITGGTGRFAGATRQLRDRPRLRSSQPNDDRLVRGIDLLHGRERTLKPPAPRV